MPDTTPRRAPLVRIPRPEPRRVVVRRKRRRRATETTDYLTAAARFIRTAGRRCAEEDEPELRQLFALERELREAFDVAVAGQLRLERSFTWLGDALGISRQAALKRFGHLQQRGA